MSRTLRRLRSNNCTSNCPSNSLSWTLSARLGDEAGLGRGPEAQALGHGDEIFELPEGNLHDKLNLSLYEQLSNLFLSFFYYTGRQNDG